MTRISFDEMKATVKKALTLAGMPEDRAEICARIHTESSRDGVYSHGLNRVERFVAYIHKGWIDVHANPTLDSNLGALEIYNGQMAPGILNAIFAMNRATEIAEKNGVGLVSLNNTTHWMRGGAYGWLAAEKDILVFVGPIQNLVCLLGAEHLEVLEITLLLWLFLEKKGTLFWIWPCHYILMENYK